MQMCFVLITEKEAFIHAVTPLFFVVLHKRKWHLFDYYLKTYVSENQRWVSFFGCDLHVPAF